MDMTELRTDVGELEICRLCLNLTVVKISIFTDDFAKMIEILTCLKIEREDSLPKISCLKCAREVKSAFLTRRRIIQCYRTLAKKMKSFINNNEQNSLQMNFDSRSAHDSKSFVEPLGNQLSESGTEALNENTLASEVEGGNPINTPEDLSEKLEQIQKLKITINSKYSDMIKSCKQKIHHWKMTNKNEFNIVKLMDSKTVATKKSKLMPSPEIKKKQSMYCTTCQLKFSNKVSYKNHMTRHRIKPCPVCGKQVRTTYLKKHMTIHEDSPAMCEVCGITCKNSFSLRMHFIYYHKSSISMCEDCGRSFRTRTKMLYHQRKDHNKERNHKCETCGKCFFSKVYLTKHINMKHMKMRPHICEYCGKGFSGKHALHTHIRQHTNEAPFQCNFCGDRFRQRVSLRGHLKSKHKIQEEHKVFCDICGKGFVTEVTLEVHRRLHSEIKCPCCSDTFAETCYLEQHLKAVHPHLGNEKVTEEEPELLDL